MYLFESAVMSGIDPLNGRAPNEKKGTLFFRNMLVNKMEYLS